MHALRGERVGFQYLVKDEVPYYRRQRFVVFILIPAVHRARGGTDEGHLREGEVEGRNIFYLKRQVDCVHRIYLTCML